MITDTALMGLAGILGLIGSVALITFYAEIKLWALKQSNGLRRRKRKLRNRSFRHSRQGRNEPLTNRLYPVDEDPLFLVHHHDAENAKKTLFEGPKSVA